MPLESLAQAMNRISAEVRGGPLSRMARGGPVRMADGGAVYDPMGNVAVPPSEGFAPSPAYENIADAVARAGSAVGSPVVGGLQTAGRVYADKSREAAAENEALRQQAMRNMAGDRAGMIPIGAGQMLLSQLGTATLPLTAAAKTAGYAATQATGNPRFGENVEFLSGFVDPTHVGMLKAAAPMAGAAAARQAVQTARELSPMGLYSHGAEAAAAMPQAKGSPEQMLAYLQNRAAVKPGELESARAAFADRPSVTREELAQHFRESMPVVEERVLGTRTKGQPYPEKYIKIEQDIMDRYRDELNRLNSIHMDYDQPRSVRDDAFKKYNNLINKRDFEIDDAIPNREELIQAARDTVVPTKFGSYTLPGGENYRELLLKTPRQETTTGDIAQKLFGRNMDELSLEEGRAVAEEMRRLGPSKQTDFTSSHWHDPNVLAHIRMSDRTGPNGEKVLHVEELQSDWAQQGRKEGFGRKAGKVEEGLDGTWQIKWPDGSFSGGYGSRTAAETALEYRGKGVPSGPYVTSTEGWTDLALKRVLKEAAEGGYDKVVWTPGAQQAKRYPDGGAEREKGMKGYYDNIVPKRLQDIARRHDKSAKVGMVEGVLPDDIAAPGIDITPAMRESILRGQPHMAEGGAVENEEKDLMNRLRGHLKRNMVDKLMKDLRRALRDHYVRGRS